MENQVTVLYLYMERPSLQSSAVTSTISSELQLGEEDLAVPSSSSPFCRQGSMLGPERQSDLVRLKGQDFGSKKVFLGPNSKSITTWSRPLG